MQVNRLYINALILLKKRHHDKDGTFLEKIRWMSDSDHHEDLIEVMMHSDYTKNKKGYHMTKKIKLKINTRLLKKDSVNMDLAAKTLPLLR